MELPTSFEYLLSDSCLTDIMTVLAFGCNFGWAQDYFLIEAGVTALFNML